MLSSVIFYYWDLTGKNILMPVPARDSGTIGWKASASPQCQTSSSDAVHEWDSRMQNKASINRSTPNSCHWQELFSISRKRKENWKNRSGLCSTFSSYFSSAHANEILHFSLHRAERRVAVNELGIKTHAYRNVHSPWEEEPTFSSIKQFRNPFTHVSHMLCLARLSFSLAAVKVRCKWLWLKPRVAFMNKILNLELAA